MFQPGTTIIRGNLTVGANVAIAGAPNNASTIILYGDLICSGSFLFTSSDNAVNLEIRKTGNQDFTYNGELNLNSLVVSEPIVIMQNTTGTLNLGSANGGGLSLVEGSAISVPFESTLRITGAGSINSNGETGKILADGGTIEISSSSLATSRLYFDETIYKSLASLKVNQTGSGSVQVLSPVEMIQGVKVSNGDLYSNGNITLLSTFDQTANLEQIEGTGRVLGEINVQRYFSAKHNTYRYISSPVTGQTIVKWQNAFPISGNFSGRSLGFSKAPSLYILGNMGQWVPYPTDADGGSGAPIVRGKGYSAFVRNTDFFTMISIGEAHQGSIPLPLNPPAPGFDGWNLVGNPYASTIQWNTEPGAWTSEGVANVIGVRNNSDTYTGQFEYYDRTSDLSTGEYYNTIAQGQAFYVQVIAPNPSLTIHEAAKYNGQQELYRQRSSDVSHLFIHLKKGNMVDKAIIAFTEVGSDEYQAQFDGSKLKNEGMFNFSTLTNDQVSVAINHMSNSFCNKEFGLNVQDVEQGDYTIVFPDFTTLHGVGAIELVDNFTNVTVNLLESNEYVFSVTDDALSYGASRFKIRMNRPELATNIVAAGADECYSSSRIVLTNAQKGASYSILDKAGNTVVAPQLSLSNELSFKVPVNFLKNGVNEFSISAGFEGCQSQVLSQRVTIEHYTMPEFSVADVSTCLGSTANITVNASSDGLAGFNWYDAQNTRIKGFTSNVMETVPVTEAMYYSVAPVMKNGCEGPRQSFIVYPEQLDEPIVFFENDTLFTTVDASEYLWTLNGNIITGADKNYLTALQAGEYSVICKNGGCSKTSKVFGVTANEDDMNAALQYELFPNPTSSGNINIRVVTPNKQDVTVKVIDVLGREHYINTFNVEELRNSVRIAPKNEFRSGVYYMILKQESRMKEIKFIIGE